jgi:hypothetical protein
MKKLVQIKFEQKKLKEIDDYRERWAEINQKPKSRSDFIREACDDKIMSILDRKEQVEMDMRKFAEEMDENAFQHWILLIVGSAFAKASHDKNFDLTKALKGVNLRKLTPELFENENNSLKLNTSSKE